jgi:tRNA/rRNA methyltransferase
VDLKHDVLGHAFYMKLDDAPQPQHDLERAGASAKQVLSRIRMVLVSTSHPGNIGSAARAIKTMGMERLELVTPREPAVLHSSEAAALAAGADDVLAQASIHTELNGAITSCQWSVAVTARSREISPPRFGMREAAAEAVARAAAGLEVAFVFGSERYGLSNAEVLQCQACCAIPTQPGFGSLNLAMAVQIATYECRMAALRGASALAAPSAELASEAEREQFFEHLERALVALEFLDPDHSPKLMGRLRRLYSRTALEREEINILRGICTAILSVTP